MCQNGSFSPHHCVGFLFFAWIPPLLFPLLHPTTHHTTTHHSSTSHNSTSHRNSSQLPFMWQAQYTELPGCLSCGRRSTHSFLNKLRRAWPPLARGCLSCHSSHTTHHCTTSHISLIKIPLITTPVLTFSLMTPRVWQAQYTEPPGPRLPHSSLHHFSHLTHHTMRVAGAVHRASWPAAAFRVAGPVHRASWLPFVWQAQYTELPGQAAARVAAAGRGCLSCHSSHTTHHCTMHLSHLTHRTTRVAGAVHRASWRSCVVWQAQYAEPWPLLARGCLSWHEAAAGPRLPFVWQAQYTQLPGQAAARVAAAGPRLPSCHSSHTTHHCTTFHISLIKIPLITTPVLTFSLMTPRVWQAQYRASWPAAAFRVAGAVHRASWTSCGARGRRWPAAACRVTHHTPLITAPLIISHLTHHTTRVAGAVHRASWRCVAAAGPRLPFLWQAQYTEPPGGAAAGYPANFGLLARCWASAPSIPHRNSMALKDGLCNAAF